MDTGEHRPENADAAEQRSTELHSAEPTSPALKKPARSGTWRSVFLLLAGLLIICGVRFALIERFTSTIPLADDWLFMDKLEAWAGGDRDWAWLAERQNGTHLVFFSRLLAAMSVEMNTLWDPRLDNFLHTLVYGAYALLLAQFFARIVPQRAMLLRGMVLFFFAVPFAGVRTTWASLNCFDFAGLFAFAAFSIQAWHGDKRWALPGALLMAVAASFSLGSGCLAGLAMAGLPLLESLTERKFTRRRLLWIVPGMLIFLGFYLTMGKPVASNPAPFVFKESLSAALKAFAWPVFMAPLAVSALVPFALLMWRWFRAGAAERATPAVRALVLAWGWLLLQAAAIGFMRGENDNYGIPSSRYNDLLMPFVFVEAATLLYLLQTAPCRRIVMVKHAWALLLVGGVSLHLLWRTWPFLAHENGEYSEWIRQRNVREFFHGNPEPLRTAQREQQVTSCIYMIGDRLEPMLNEIKAGNWKSKTAGSMTGVIGIQPYAPKPNPLPLLVDGVPPEYFKLPPLIYLGTHYPERLEATTGRGRTNPFHVTGDYLTFDLIVDKKARFTNYRLDGLELKLVPVVEGPEVDVLAALRQEPPYLLRDRESVCVRVEPGDYHLEYADESLDQSLAFSVPIEGGRCAGWLHAWIQSSKLLIAAGIGILALLVLFRPKHAHAPA